MGLGEGLLAAVVMGAIIGTASYMIGVTVAIMNGADASLTLSGMLKSAFWGAVSGAVTFGIGSFAASAAGANAAFSSSLQSTKFLLQAAAHGVAQGALAMMQNGGAGFLSGAAGGFFGSRGATAWSAGAGKFANSGVGTIAFGALSGGVGAELAGGNFWQGAVTGGIVAGLNHAMHQVDFEDPKPKMTEAHVYVENDGVGHVYLEVDGTVYSYGRYNGSYSPASGSLGPLGDGVLLKLEGKNAANFIAERTQKYPTSKYSVKVNASSTKAYYDKLYNSGTPLTGKHGFYSYGRSIDTYNLVGPGGNNCATLTYKAIRAGGTNVGAWQAPADVNRYYNGGNIFFK